MTNEHKINSQLPKKNYLQPDKSESMELMQKHQVLFGQQRL